MRGPLTITAAVTLASVACALGCRERTAPRSAEPAPPRSVAQQHEARAPASSAPAPAAPAQDAGVARLPEPVDLARLRRTVEQVSKPRVPGSAHWKRVQQLCADALRASGLEVELQRYGTGVNVIGVGAGEASLPERVVISAHYDHIPGCDGADDNASGVAALFEIARLLGKSSYRRTFVAACWDEEERGLNGSRAYSERARSRGEVILGAVSLDGVGFASSKPGSQLVPPGFELAFPEQAAALAARGRAGDFIAVVSRPPARSLVTALSRHAAAAGLPVIELELGGIQSLLMRDAYRSDHASFWLSGYPALLLTDTANFRNPAYHCARGPDTPATLDYEFLKRVTEATALAALELLEPEP